jgi:hypothetical protein
MADTTTTPTPPAVVSATPATTSSPSTVTVIAADFAKYKADVEAWASKQETWLEKNWVALLGHLSTIGVVIGSAKWLATLKNLV